MIRSHQPRQKHAEAASIFVSKVTEALSAAAKGSLILYSKERLKMGGLHMRSFAMNFAFFTNLSIYSIARKL
jgi:hypothetical protein